jgi:hypothetical protein
MTGPGPGLSRSPATAISPPLQSSCDRHTLCFSRRLRGRDSLALKPGIDAFEHAALGFHKPEFELPPSRIVRMENDAMLRDRFVDGKPDQVTRTHFGGLSPNITIK